MQLASNPDAIANGHRPQDTPPSHHYSFKQWWPALIPLIAIVIVGVLGTADKPAEDINWLSRLASEGDSGAQLQVGLAYRNGRYGLTADAEKGLYWLKLAAENGNAYAEDTVATMYATGSGTPKDPAQAIIWWRKSMQDGDNEARLHLGEALLKSGDVQQAESLLHNPYEHLELNYK